MPFILLAMLFGSYFYHGYVISLFWLWFIVPVFGLPALPIPVSVAIMAIIVMMTHKVNEVEFESTKFPSRRDRFIMAAFTMYFRPTMVLIILTITSLFM